MIYSWLRTSWTHFKVRSVAVFRSPAAMTALILFGVTGIIYWPGATSMDLAHASPLDTINEGMPLIIVWLFWFWLWPMLPMVYVGGRATGKARSNPLAFLGAPALPVGPGARALAEAVLALSVMGTVRFGLAGLSWLQGPWGADFSNAWTQQQSIAIAQIFSQTLGGAIIILPMALAWALPASSLNFFMWRPLAVAVVATGLHAVGGPLGTWPGVVLAGLTLSALVLYSTRFEGPRWRWKPALRPAGSRARPALGPQTQLNRDAWLPITRTWGPWFALATLVFIIGLVLDVRGLGWDWAFFGGFELFLIIGLQPLFRPLGLNVVAESLVGKHGAERGDFMRSWAVLPVGHEAVLRRVWLHGMVIGLILWAVPVGLLALRARLRLGSWGLRAADGHSLGEFVILGAAIVPMMAGLLVAAALGRKVETAVSGLIVLVGIYTLLPAKLLLTEVFGVGATTADTALALYFAVLVVAASAPPLRFLRNVPRIEGLQ